MRYIYKDFDIYYDKYGFNDKIIVVLPGWGNTRETFNFFINHLSHEYTIYILDYPGFGNSLFPNRDLEIEDYCDLIENFIKDQKITKPILIGHSFGCRIIFSLATNKAIDIDKIILMGAAGIKKRKSIWALIKQTTYKLLKKIKYILPKKYKESYLNKLINIFGSSDYKNLNNNIRTTFIKIVNKDLSKNLSRINQEVLLIWGEKDTDTPLKDAFIIQKKIKNSGLVIIKNAPHYCYLYDPIYVLKIIKCFIRNIK